MLEKLKSKIISSNSGRTEKAHKNIILSLILKGINMAVFLLMVPVTLRFLKQEEYGIWLTLSSLLLYISYLDIGLGHGLRNRLAIAFAKKDIRLAKEYISTSYAILLLILLLLVLSFSLLLLISNYPVEKFLNSPDNLAAEVRNLITVVFILTSVQFVLKTITIILLADQRPAISDLINTLGNLLSFIVIYFLSVSSKGSLLDAGIIFTSCPLIVLAGFSIWFFKGRYRSVRPAINFVNFSHTNALMGIGMKFFIIQIASLVMWNSSNLVISHISGPKEVTSFNIAFRYFSIATILFTVVLTPYWSAFTEAYQKNETDWIKKNIKGLLIFFLISAFLSLIMILIAPFVYSVWIGKDFITPLSLNLFLGLFVILTNWQNIFVFFLNGIGKITIQLISNILIGLLCIPINIYCVKEWGISGAAIALIIASLPSTIFAPVQYYLILYKNKGGIWNH